MPVDDRRNPRAADDRDKYIAKTPPAGVRAQTQPGGVPILPADDSTSGAIEDPEARRDWRSQQPWERRIERLEEKHDDLGAIVHGMNGKLDFMVDSARASNTEREDRRARELRDEEQREKAAERRAITIRAVIAILVPMVIAIGAIVTAIVLRAPAAGAK